MAVTFIRTTIVYITLIIIMRLMGKRQIGEMQPYEFIVTLIIADLACIPMADVSIPLIYGIAGILALFILHQILSLLEQCGKPFKRIISGKPSLVINKMGVDVVELKRNNLGVDDLIESVRTTGYFSLDELDYAVFESNGKLSVMSADTPPSPPPKSMPLLIVDDGKIDNKNIELIKTSKANINSFITANGGTLKSTEVLTIDGDGRAYFKQKNKKFRVLQFNHTEGVKW